MANRVIGFDPDKPRTGLPDVVEHNLDTTYGQRLYNPAQVAADVEQRMTGKKVVVILRHDDVQPSALGFLPLYRKHKMKASWYMATGLAGSASGPGGTPIVTAEQLDEIFADGHEIGSHTTTHLYANTDNTTDAQWRKSLEDSKRWLEDRYGHTGYTCDTLALPGNQIPTPDAKEHIALDYYLAALADGPTHRPINQVQEFITWRNGYPSAWLDRTGTTPNPGATLETDRAATRAMINEMAASDGGRGAVSVIQIHNQDEVSIPQLDMMLGEFAADERVIVLTAREWVHYVRRRYVTLDGGKHYYPQSKAEDLVHRGASYQARAFNLDGDMSMNGIGRSHYWMGTGPRFRVFTPTDTELRVRDQTNGRDILRLTQSTSRMVTSTWVESIAVSGRMSLTHPDVPNSAWIFLGTGAPTEALGAVHKGSLYLQGDGDADSTVWVKTEGGTTGWKLLGQHEATRTSAQLASAADTINVQGKATGRRVFDTTVNKPLWATGSTPTATWVDAMGTVVHTPA